MRVHLLDANVLIALTVREHEHHDTASAWLGSIGQFALCPIVEGALIRFLIRVGETAPTAAAVLEGVRRSRRCEFWPDELSYADVDLVEIRGHRQVTAAYLAGLAGARGAHLATFDRALALRFPGTAVLVT